MKTTSAIQVSLAPESARQSVPAPSVKPRRLRPRRRLILTAGTLVVLLAMLTLAAAGRGYKTALLRALGFAPARQPAAFKVALIAPEDGAVGVAVDSAVTIAFRLGTNDAIDQDTLTSGAVVLVRAGDQVPVPADLRRRSVGEVELRPHSPLRPLTDYNLWITPSLRTDGHARAQTSLTGFTTAGASDPGLRFEQLPLPTTAGMGATALTFGPDGKLYVGTDEGAISRYAVNADGTLGEPEKLDGLVRHAGGPRLLIGLVFDPRSTPDAPIAWVTHNFCGFENVPDFTGAVSRLSGKNLEVVEDVVVGLPRSIRDHATNQPAFGPDGALYIPQPSNSAFGAPDAFWGMRPEHLLNASILRLDTRRVTPGRPIDVKTRDCGGTYDPYAPDAPLTIHATGVRLAYELIWHSNGSLYAPTNGSSLGGNAPAGPNNPAIATVPFAEDDWLHRVTPGSYHGHPNPAQGHTVLNGGNPTRDYDFAETPMYPVGTMPDSAYVKPAWVMGQHVSANGVIEYRSNTFDGRLKGKLLICRYSRGRDIAVVTVNPDGSVAGMTCDIPGLKQFENPLDIAEDPRTGNLYVSEYGARKVTLCRPAK